MNPFLYGLSLPFRAWRLILKDARLLALSLLPLILALALYFWAGQLISGWLDIALTRLFMNWGWNPGGAGASAVLWLARLGLLLLGAWTFSFSASILGLPFLDFLAERAERLADPPLEAVPSRGFRARIRLLFLDGFRSLALLVLALIDLVLSWIPGLNLLAFALTCVILALQYVSFPQTRRGISIAESLVFGFQHLPLCLGFGISLSFLYSIPIVGACTLPAAVVGGTLLFARATAGT